MPAEEPSSLSVLEERIAAEEEVICERVRALERQVQTLHEHKVAVQQARVLAESHEHAEAELKRWEASLFAEVESATCRLREQRQAAAASSNPRLALALARTPAHTGRRLGSFNPGPSLSAHPDPAPKHRQAQLDRCTAFDVSLAQKILALQQMQVAAWPEPSPSPWPPPSSSPSPSPSPPPSPSPCRLVCAAARRRWTRPTTRACSGCTPPAPSRSPCVGRATPPPPTSPPPRQANNTIFRCPPAHQNRSRSRRRRRRRLLARRRRHLRRGPPPPPRRKAERRCLLRLTCGGHRAGPPTDGRTRHTRRSRSRQGRGAWSWGTGSAQIHLDPPGPARSRLLESLESVRACHHRPRPRPTPAGEVPLPLPLLGLLARCCSEHRPRRMRRRRRGQGWRRRWLRSRAPFRTQRTLSRWRMPRRMTSTPYDSPLSCAETFIRGCMIS